VVKYLLFEVIIASAINLLAGTKWCSTSLLSLSSSATQT
jgi:hypothetical protein